jgi:hypothetical protein
VQSSVFVLVFCSWVLASLRFCVVFWLAAVCGGVPPSFVGQV